MVSRVMCISRTIGAGGEEIGRAAAKELGFRYADEQIIIRAAALSPDAQVRTAEAMSSRLRREPLGGCGCGLLAPRALVAIQEDLAEAHIVRSHLQALVFAD